MVQEGIVLGHKILVRGIEVDKAKIDVIEKLPLPMNVKGVRSFLGHAGFYRKFIKDFSKVAKPLSNLLNKVVDFVFNEECMEALSSREGLQIYDYRLPFKSISKGSTVS